MTKLYPGVPDARTAGGPDEVLTHTELSEFVHTQLSDHDFDGKRVTLVVPDGTRHAPVAMMAKLIRDALGSRPASVRVVIALGTHDYMSDEAIGKLMGCEPGRFADTYPGWEIVNHLWRDESTFATSGRCPGSASPSSAGAVSPTAT